MAFRIQMTGLNTGFNIGFSGRLHGFEIGFDGSHIETPPYEGDYVVVSLPYDDQVFPTKDKRMLDNLTVKKIPVQTTHNPYGTTISISS